MTQHRRALPSGQRCMAWLLLLAVALMGLTVTRQQVLGSLHSHTDQGPRLSVALHIAVSSLGSDWARRWQQQHILGHGQMLMAATDSTDWPSDTAEAANATRLHESHAHNHDSLERHHHAAHDASVVALDGAAELANASDSPASGASLLLFSLAAPSAALTVPANASHMATWPSGRFAALASRSVPPLLRPPSV